MCPLMDGFGTMTSRLAWDDLIEQLQDPEPKARRRAVRQMAKTRDPQVIPFLRNVYLQEDDDDVRSAAEAALRQFRALQQGGPMQQGPVSDAALTRILVVLGVVFLALLIANIGVRLIDLPSGESGISASGGPVPERSELERALQNRLDETRSSVAALRESDRVYRESGTLLCPSDVIRPAPLELSPATLETYRRDLAGIAGRINTTLNLLRIAQTRWDHMCSAGQASMAELVRASAELDQVEVDLALLDRDLATAIASPAPTSGPSPTPPPTATLPPSLTPTPDPNQPTEAAPPPPAETPPSSDIPAPTSTPPPTPTITPTLSPTPLPLPDLDYPQILRELNRRLAILGDLQRPYKNGILDNWQRSQSGEILSPSSCALDPWPGLFEWTDEQRAQLDRRDAADPQLETAVRLINEGLALAIQARALYEPSCYAQTLASTADTGIPLATSALEKLTEALHLVEQIRRRAS